MDDKFILICCECGNSIELPRSYGWMTGNSASTRCQKCGTRQEFSSVAGQLQGQKPLETPRIWYSELTTAIHEDARRDFLEGVKAFNAQCFKSTVVMCRRSLQISVIDKGANGDKLNQQIEDLKNIGKIDISLYHFASGCRQLGNYGAHPQDDELRDVDEGAAKLVLDITYKLLGQLYSDRC
jgi:hypothetical protein